MYSATPKMLPKPQGPAVTTRKNADSATFEEHQGQQPKDGSRHTVVLFYKYVRVSEPCAERTQQLLWLEELSLTGRIRIAAEGINATLYGTTEAMEVYKQRMNDHELFKNIQYKHSMPQVSEQVGDEPCTAVDPFDGIRNVRVCDEITSTGMMRSSLPTGLGGRGGTHLPPRAFHELACEAEHSDDIVLIDTRNHYETAVGKFAFAVDPKLRCFTQFPSWVDVNKAKLASKRVLMYCTGGVRCEKASSYLNSLGIAKEVYQLEGGIHHYLSEFNNQSGCTIDKVHPAPDHSKQSGPCESQPTGSHKSLFVGTNFQFDNRLSAEICGHSGVHDEQDLASYEADLSRCCYCFKHRAILAKHNRCSVCTDFIPVCLDCAEHHDTFHCAEHMLLSSHWENYLQTLISQHWTLHDFSQLISNLEALVSLCEYKAQQGSKSQGRRRKNLLKQVERLKQFQKVHLESDEITSGPSRSADEDTTFGQEPKSNDHFVPFVPMLNP